MFTELGRRVPAHACAAGKAMLAFQSPDVLADLRDRAPFSALTPHTITAAEELEAELRQAHEDGYAVDHEEYEDGVICVAAPIFGSNGEVLAAASVSGPAARIQRRELTDLGELVRTQMLEVSRELGYVPAPGARTPASGAGAAA
jgi:IclR family acetate operon transcriptional repressor